MKESRSVNGEDGRKKIHANERTRPTIVLLSRKLGEDSWIKLVDDPCVDHFVFLREWMQKEQKRKKQKKRYLSKKKENKRRRKKKKEEKCMSCRLSLTLQRGCYHGVT